MGLTIRDTGEHCGGNVPILTGIHLLMLPNLLFFLYIYIITYDQVTVVRRQSRVATGLAEKQGKSEGFDSCDRPSNLAQIWSKSSIFQPVWLWNLVYDLEKY